MATIPTIHLNGTGATTLRDEYAAAYDAIGKAVDALVAATCNARDFYPQGTDAYYKARDERAEAFDKLRQAQHYVGEMLMGICDQCPEARAELGFTRPSSHSVLRRS